MSQNDLSIANQGFASFRSDLNSALQALGSTNSGTSAPSTTYANQLFYDTTNNILKIRNEDNDAFISLFTLDQSNDNIESLTINGALSAESLDLNGGELILDADNDTSITSDTDDRVDIKVAGSDIVHVTSTGLGIGTSSPSFLLHQSGTGDQRLEIDSTNNNSSGLFFKVLNSGSTVGQGTIRTSNSGSMEFFTGTSSDGQRLTINSSGKVGIGTTSPDDFLEVKGSTNTTTRQVKIVDSSDATATHIGQFSNVSYFTNNTFFNGGAWTRDDGAVGTAFLGLGDGVVQFGTDTGATPSERMRIDSSGNVLINTTGTTLGTDGVRVLPGGSGTGTFTEFMNDGGGIVMRISRGGSDGICTQFARGSSVVGSISVDSSNTTYSTSSDYRLKENVVTDWDATTRLKQLKPSRFNFKIDKDKTVDGFLAHEVSSIVPEAITGTKDAVDADGNPEYQGIDQSKLVPLMVKTIQELEARIATLEAK